MDSLELKERNIILIPLTEFSGNIFEKIMGYKSTIKYIFLYRNYKFDRIISSEKFPIILLNNIDSLIDTLKDDYKLSKNLNFNYDDILKGKHYYLGLKENMSYKINLNNFTQKYLEYRDNTKIYSSLQNLIFLTLYDAYNFYTDISLIKEKDQSAMNKMIENLSKMMELMEIFDEIDYFKFSNFIINLFVICMYLIIHIFIIL